MKTNADLITSFYSAFERGDADGMTACYSDNIIFKDPAFGELHGDDAKNMWRMLVERSRGDLKVMYGDVVSDEKGGRAQWVAVYHFSQTGRKITNKIRAYFWIEDGKIVRHEDHFSLWKWSAQALGWKGYLLGWTPFMGKQIQKQTGKLLKAYARSQSTKE
jgi:ketosteroid isomerase-like protein